MTGDSARAASPGGAGRRLEIETPEHVAVGYELADLGSRFTALFLDGLVVGGIMLALGIGIPLVVSLIGPLPEAVGVFGRGALVLLLFAAPYGYFVYFEGFRDGQTPGKSRMKIRAVHDGGYPLTVRGAAIRNLLRIVDMQPGFTWMVGGVAMMLHSRTKRLGDMAAGSVVVRERTMEALPEEAIISSETQGTPEAAKPAIAGAPALSEDEFAVLSRYVARREELPRERRALVAGRIAAKLEARESWDRRKSADDHLQDLYELESARRAASGLGGAGGSAEATALVRRRRQRWDEYAGLLEEAREKGLERLDEQRVSRFAAEYRAIAADLARARTYGGSGELIYTLERLVGAGHNLLYRTGGRSFRRLWLWLTGGFPALVRARWRAIALAAAFLFVPAVASYSVVTLEPARARSVLPGTMIARAEEAAQREAEGRGYIEVPDVFMPLLASGVIANNVQVTFAAFAGGILAGVGTLLILVFNGVMLGSVAGLFAAYGVGMQLWSFVLPHGVIELTAIAIAGGAGLWLGSALVLPGRSTRREALVERGREAVSLLAGTVLLLVVAGVIEGFLSPSPIPRGAKLLFASVAGLGVLAYLTLAGTGAEAQEEAAGMGKLRAESG